MTRPALASTIRTLTVGTCLGLMVAGCNTAVPDTGADPGESGARDTANGLVTGLTTKDGALACSLMDANAMKALNARTKASSCPQAVGAMAGSHPDVTAVTVDGESATVTVTSPPSALPGPWHLVRESGHWVLHSAG